MKLSELLETTDLTGYQNLLGDVGVFITLNLSKIASYGTDTDAVNKLREMQQNLQKPILNGLTFVQVYDQPTLYKNPKIIPIMLKYVYDLIRYTEPRIQQFVDPTHLGKFEARISNIKQQYKN